ncbi:MAG: hypothetical protein ACE15E_25220, partial [Acidobacteriota bacterium]
ATQQRFLLIHLYTFAKVQSLSGLKTRILQLPHKLALMPRRVEKQFPQPPQFSHTFSAFSVQLRLIADR